MPRRPFTLIAIAAVLLALWQLLQSPGSLTEVLAPDPVFSAGQSLLQPLGILRLVRIYTPETEPSKKR